MAIEVRGDERQPSQHQHSRAGVALLWSAVVVCPCHWPLLILGLFGGTVIAAALRSHFLLIVAFATLYFAAAIAVGLWLLHRGRLACATCRVVRPGPPLGSSI